ncbi:hypothetical protein D3C76_1385940 [compost metagenome]
MASDSLCGDASPYRPMRKPRSIICAGAMVGFNSLPVLAANALAKPTKISQSCKAPSGLGRMARLKRLTLRTANRLNVVS